MSRILVKYKVAAVDLLILDVEGAEPDVLAGLDFARHAPRFLVVKELDATVVDFSPPAAMAGRKFSPNIPPAATVCITWPI